MSARTTLLKVVICDNCTVAHETRCFSMDQARRAAAEKGWVTILPLTDENAAPDYRQIRDLCPSCAPVVAQ